MHWKRLALPLLLIAIPTAPLRAVPGEKLYWTDSDPASFAIRRANPDGTDVELVLGGLSHPRGLAIDRLHSRLYWMNAGTSEIRSVRLDGTDERPVVGIPTGYSAGPAVDPVGGKLYWCQGDQNSLGTEDRIRRADLDGSNVQDLVTTGLALPTGIALDLANGKVIWSDVGNQTIQRANLDGTGVQTIVANTNGIVQALTVDPLAAKLYWGSMAPQAPPAPPAGSIFRSDLDGSNVQTLFTNVEAPTVILPYPSHGAIFWTQSHVTGSPGVLRGHLATGTITTIIGVGVPWGQAWGPDVVLGCTTDESATACYGFEEGNDGQAALPPATIPSSCASGAAGVPVGGPFYRSTTYGPIVPQTGKMNRRTLEFDGVDDRVDFAQPFVFCSPVVEATFEISLKLPAQPHCAIVWGPVGGPDLDRFHLYTGGIDALGMDYRDANGVIHRLLPADLGPPYAFTITPNQWVHLAVTRVAGPGGIHEYRFYKDGNPTPVHVGIDAQPSPPTTNRGWSLSGRPAPHNLFQGQVDQIRFSNRVLDPSEFLITPMVDLNGTGMPDRCEVLHRTFCAGSGLDPMVTTACPCGNFGGPDHGCANSVDSSGGRLDVSGRPVPDGIQLHGTSMPTHAACLYVQGDQSVETGLVFGDGVRCIDGTLVRLRLKSNVNGASTYPDVGEPSVSSRGGVTPGSGTLRWYQTFYRNPAAAFCPPATFNMTNGVEILW
jgi:hypothetical protein